MGEEKVGFVKMGEAEAAKEVREIGVGMLGYAFMGKAHTNAFIKMPIFFYPPPAKPKLVAIFGRTEDKVREAAKRYGYRKYYTDWKALIKDPEVEVLDNGLPNHMHHDPCIMAAELGKHVICEKPLARNAKEAEEMYRAVEKAGVKHMVAFNYRFVPAIRLAKQLIDEGYIGKILQFRGVYLQEWIMDPNFPLVWRLRKDVAGSGALGDLGSHVIDLARFLVGEINSVTGLLKTFIEERPLPEDPSKKGKVDVDDAFIALVKFSNGVIGSIEATRFAAGRKNYQRIEIHGSEGTIVFNLERLNELEVYTNKEPLEKRGFKTILVTEAVHPFYDKWWPHGHIIGWEHTFVHEIHHFFDAVVNDKPIEPWGATFYDGLRANKIMDAIEKSAQTGKWESTE
ncbi:MAG: Gfo/Idh/MocA family oxidoreductase [Thaumarchaeota archaeon]|nr:Gfo/Idh/MocA family oxidoreductase [Nitrososphaerota archaeon]